MSDKTTFTALPLFTDKSEFKPVEMPKENWFKEAKKFLGHEISELPCFEIEGHRFTAVCDEEGLLVDDPVFTVYQKDRMPLFAGNVLVMHVAYADEEGETILEDLTEEELEILRYHSQVAVSLQMQPKGSIDVVERRTLIGARQISYWE